jgi:aminoglycoside phosphotransferase (APT) family kinase protein
VHMTALELELPGGEVSTVVVRQPKQALVGENPGAAEVEFRLLQLTKSFGLPSPTPRLLDESGDIFATPYLVLDYVEGASDFSLAAGLEVARQMARLLAAIHRIDRSMADLSFLPQVERTLVAPLR